MEFLKQIIDLIIETQNRFFPGIHVFFIPANWYIVELAKSLLRALRITDRWYDFWCRFIPCLVGAIYMPIIANNKIGENLSYKLMLTNIVLGFLLGAASAFFYKLFKPWIKAINKKAIEYLNVNFLKKNL